MARSRSARAHRGREPFRPDNASSAPASGLVDLFFLQSGMVSVKLPTGCGWRRWSRHGVWRDGAARRPQAADVWADTRGRVHRASARAYTGFREKHPQIGERIMRNLAALLAKRLILANTKIDLLTSR